MVMTTARVLHLLQQPREMQEKSLGIAVFRFPLLSVFSISSASSRPSQRLDRRQSVHNAPPLVRVRPRICRPGACRPGRRPTLDARDVAVLGYSNGFSCCGSIIAHQSSAQSTVVHLIDCAVQPCHANATQ